MCLFLRKNGYEEGEKGKDIKWNKDGERTFYKVYYKTNNYKIKNTSGKRYLRSIYRRDVITGAGTVVSDRTSQTLSNDYETRSVDHGIHVFLDREDAEVEAERYNCVDVDVVPVRCKKSDFVATGWFFDAPSAVFMKVLIDNKTWKRIWK